MRIHDAYDYRSILFRPTWLVRMKDRAIRALYTRSVVRRCYNYKLLLKYFYWDRNLDFPLDSCRGSRAPDTDTEPTLRRGINAVIKRFQRVMADNFFPVIAFADHTSRARLYTISRIPGGLTAGKK